MSTDDAFAAHDSVQRLLRLERWRQWCVTGMWLPGVWVLVGAALLVEYSMVWVGAGGAMGSTWFDRLAAVYVGGWFVTGGIGIVALIAHRIVCRVMESGILMLREEWWSTARVGHGTALGRVRVEFPREDAVVATYTPLSWHLQWALSKGLVACCVVFVGVAVQRALSVGVTGGLLIAMGVCLLFTLVASFAMARTRWIEVDGNGDNPALRVGTRVLGLPVLGGRCGRVVPWDSGTLLMDADVSVLAAARPALIVFVGSGVMLHGFSKGVIGMFQARLVHACIRFGTGMENLQDTEQDNENVQ